MEVKVFEQDAKQIVDQLFDAKMLKDDVTRDQMNVFEDLVHFLLKSKYDSYLRITKLTESISKLEKTS